MPEMSRVTVVSCGFAGLAGAGGVETEAQPTTAIAKTMGRARLKSIAAVLSRSVEFQHCSAIPAIVFASLVMGGRMKRWMSAAALGALATVCLAPPAFAADRVSGVLTATFVIVDNTDLIGDVRCDVANNTPCFSFGVPGVELRLNGFTITGKGDAVTGCGGGASMGNETGVATNGMSRVGVRGPGLVQRFRGDGVFVFGSTDAWVIDLTVSTNCLSGVRVAATSFGTLVQNNTAVRNGSPTASCGGI
jgi:hypothetical protein